MRNKIIVRSSFKDKHNFRDIPELRKGVIEQAPTTPLTGNHAVNSIANFLHTPTQFLKVKHVEEISSNAMAYVLEPDAAHGTAKLAYFKAGQNISIAVSIKGRSVSRSVPLCSSPLMSTEDEYLIIVNKKTEDEVFRFILENWRKDTETTASSPFGYFCYQMLRDSKNIIGICDNEGYQPFLSMAEAIYDGSLNANLTLIYSARKQNEIIMKERFDELSQNSTAINTVYVFSDEHVFKCERGFVTKSLIEKYTPAGKYSIFVSCSPERYINIKPQIYDLHLEKKYVRTNPVCKVKNPSRYDDYPQENAGKVYLCKIIKEGKLISTLPCYAEETILSAFEKEGLESNSRCRAGECGFCKALLIDGNVFTPAETDSRKKADINYGIIHPCCTYPLSNLVIELQ